MTTIRELSNLKGRRALITGAAGNLGGVFADTLAELGADLVLVDLPGSDVESLSKSLIQRWGVKIEPRFCDLELSDHRTELINWMKESGRGLHVLINNAAFAGSTDLPGWRPSPAE